MSRSAYPPHAAYCVLRTATGLGRCVLVTAALGCASSGATTRAAVPATAGAARADSAALPPLAIDQISDGGVSAQRVRHFDAVNQDVRLVVRALAENFGLGHQIDPDVKGMVNTRLENATLEQALATVLGPLGYAYQVEGGVVRVSGMRLQTQIFSLDYVSLNRIGTTSTIVTRRIGTTGTGAFGSNLGTAGLGQLGQPPVGLGGLGQGALGLGGGTVGGGNLSGGGESITSVTAADLWAEIRVGLEAIVFDGDTAGGRTSVQAGTGMAGQFGTGVGSSGASSRSSGDGRRLIINPLAGTIFVTATPAKLAEVAAYITAVQSAVQRQVLIEAKIVEVELRREFRFGIDWRTLSERAKIAIDFAGAREGTLAPQNTLTIKLGGGSSQIQLALQALETQGDVSVLASPMLSALNNQPAVFDATQDEVFFAITRIPIIGPTGTVTPVTQVVPQQISVGIVLNVLAHIGADQVITMNIRPGLSDVTGMARQALPEGGEVVVPIISRRETDTMARVRAGETIIIGGLTRTRRRRDRSGVPVLQDIPGVGGLFRTTENEDLKNEIVIFLTPTIIAGSSSATAVR